MYSSVNISALPINETAHFAPHCYKVKSNWCNRSDSISLLAGYFIRIFCDATSCVSEKNCFATS